MDTIRVVLIIKTELLRLGMERLLSSAHGIKVVATGSTSLEAVQLAIENQFDILLIDSDIYGYPDSIERVAVFKPNVKIILLTKSEKGNNVALLITAGTEVYVISQNIGYLDMINVLHFVSRDSSKISASLARRILDHFSSLSQKKRNEGFPLVPLTKREEEVLLLVASGADNIEIAHKLYISQNTIKVHIRNIMEKLCLHRRSQLVALANRKIGVNWS